MLRLALAVAALTGPMIAATSLRSDIDYWHSAHIWQHNYPVTYYAHTLLLIALALTAHHRRRRT